MTAQDFLETPVDFYGLPLRLDRSFGFQRQKDHDFCAFSVETLLPPFSLRPKGFSLHP